MEITKEQFDLIMGFIKGQQKENEVINKRITDIERKTEANSKDLNTIRDGQKLKSRI